MSHKRSTRSCQGYIMERWASTQAPRWAQLGLSNRTFHRFAAGHQVIVVDDLPKGQKDHIGGEAKFHWIDIRRQEWGSTFECERTEYVTYHASDTGAHRSLERCPPGRRRQHPRLHQPTQCCTRCGVKKITYASTGGAAYAEPDYLAWAKATPYVPSRPTQPASMHRTCTCTFVTKLRV